MEDITDACLVGIGLDSKCPTISLYHPDFTLPASGSSASWVHRSGLPCEACSILDRALKHSPLTLGCGGKRLAPILPGHLPPCIHSCERGAHFCRRYQGILMREIWHRYLHYVPPWSLGSVEFVTRRHHLRTSHGMCYLQFLCWPPFP